MGMNGDWDSVFSLWTGLAARCINVISGSARLAALQSVVALAACGSLPRTPYTAADACTSRVLNIDGLRRYTDEPVANFSFEKDNFSTPRIYLALSGGGAYGA